MEALCARGRSRGVVHAARAYLAGVGTTGSLLAAAALVFIVARALVAFHGWPHVAVQQTTNTLGGAVGGVSPAAGGVVQSAGSGAAQTVTRVTQGLGGLLSGLGH
jgi:hypothetical protein